MTPIQEAIFASLVGKAIAKALIVGFIIALATGLVFVYAFA